MDIVEQVQEIIEEAARRCARERFWAQKQRSNVLQEQPALPPVEPSEK